MPGTPSAVGNNRGYLLRAYRKGIPLRDTSKNRKATTDAGRRFPQDQPEGLQPLGVDSKRIYVDRGLTTASATESSAM